MFNLLFRHARIEGEAELGFGQPLSGGKIAGTVAQGGVCLLQMDGDRIMAEAVDAGCLQVPLQPVPVIGKDGENMISVSGIPLQEPDFFILKSGESCDAFSWITSSIL